MTPSLRSSQLFAASWCVCRPSAATGERSYESDAMAPRAPQGAERPRVLLAAVLIVITAAHSVTCRIGHVTSAQHISGSPLSARHALSRLQCGLHCLSTESCDTFTWRPAGGECHLFTWQDGCNQERLADSADGTEMVRLQRCPPTCRDLRDLGVTADGVYQLSAVAVPVLCDLTLDGGGWTLLVTSTSVDGWNTTSARERSVQSPSLTDNYSILRFADQVKAVGTGASFQYRLEGRAQEARQQWGGIWRAPRVYSLMAESMEQSEVTMLKRFSSWTTGVGAIEDRVPWINTMGYSQGIPVLTTAGSDGKFWGTLITSPTYPVFSHSPWIYSTGGMYSGTVLYWLREEDDALN